MRLTIFYFFLLFLFTVSCSSVTPAVVQSPPVPAVAENATFAIVEAQSGRWIAGENLDQKIVPASSIKVFTTYAAIKILGADFTFLTEVEARGKIKNGILKGDLILKGSGDPTLVSADLLDLAFQLQRSGIREVRGNLYFSADSFAFSPRISVDVEASEPYNSPVAGINLDFNQFSDAEGRHPLSNPPETAAKRFAQFSRALGLILPAPRPVPQKTILAPKIWVGRHRSQTLNQIVRSTLEFSNNLFAESLCMAAAHRQLRRPVTIVDGAQTAHAFLSSRSFTPDGVGEWSLENCSGLGMGTRISAKQYVKIFKSIYEDRKLSFFFPALLNFSNPEFTALGKSGGLDYHVSLGGILLSAESSPRLFFMHFSNPTLREQTRSQGDLRHRKAQAQEWGRFFRQEIQNRLSPFGVTSFP